MQFCRIVNVHIRNRFRKFKINISETCHSKSAGFKNLVSAIGHVIWLDLLDYAIYLFKSGADKRLIRTRQELRFHESLVCIMLNISSWLTARKNLLSQVKVHILVQFVLKKSVIGSSLNVENPRRAIIKTLSNISIAKNIPRKDGKNSSSRYLQKTWTSLRSCLLPLQSGHVAAAQGC